MQQSYEAYECSSCMNAAVILHIQSSSQRTDAAATLQRMNAAVMLHIQCCCKRMNAAGMQQMNCSSRMKSIKAAVV